MKRKYSKISEGDFVQKKIKFKKVFDGIVNYIKFDSSIKPSYVSNKLFLNKCIKKNEYFWFELFPKNDNYVITIMFDNNHNIIQWYIDISKKVVYDADIPYQDDLYLDLIVIPSGEKCVLDIDEINEALDKNIISIDDYNFAYKILEKVEKKYTTDFNVLLDLTKYIYNEFIDMKLGGKSD